MIIKDELEHIGVLQKSGRYPWGSGSNPQQRSTTLLGMVQDLKKKGLTDKEIIVGLDLRDSKTDEYYTTTQYRALRTIAVNEKRAGDISQAQRLKTEGNSNVAIGKQMGINESSVRSLLAPSAAENSSRIKTTSDMLKTEFEEKPYLDIGRGTSQRIGVTKGTLDTSIAALKEEGYEVMYVNTKQASGNDTHVKVLVPPGTTYSDLYKNQEKIGIPGKHSDDYGREFVGIRPIENLKLDRVSVRYAEQGGADMDGVIELRRGVSDLDIGGAKYAQVRIGVDGDRYLKGMAVYADDLPKGVDARFNTNKSDTGDKRDAMKKQNIDKDTGLVDVENPFGASIKPGGQRGALNILQEEGDWSKWSKTLSSQMLSKQTPDLVKGQLELTHKIKKDEFDEIMSLTNPEVKRKLLDSFADDADASSVHLKAAGLPRTAQHVLLPVNSVKDNEIFAPQYKNGESVVLIRHPHGGKFEIPELTVNNKNPQAKNIMDQARDAVGINSKVAAQLSGADFDGDTVLVIPNPTQGRNRVLVQAPLKELKGFDPQSSYPKYEGMKLVGEPGGGNKQMLMGDVSNLITDMTIKGASAPELARAVRHSMVVIDAEKHGLNWKQSEKDHNIRELKTKYQLKESGRAGGASTLISLASSEQRVNDRKGRSAKEGGPIDAKTGELKWTETGKTYERKVVDPKTGKETIEVVPSTMKSTKMGEAKDARSLSSGTVIETIYADHANHLKALANSARRESLATKPTPYNRAARDAYEPEYTSLRAKLNLAISNAPLERKALLLANAEVKARRQANPNMDGDERKKLESQAMAKARVRTGADKQRVDVTDNEWSAIQAGAISPSFLRDILNNTDVDKIKALATPRTQLTVTPAKLTRAKAMLARGFQQSEIAESLGLSTSTLNDALSS